MNGLFSRKWFVSVIAVWITVMMLDELAFLWWKKVNPGSLWSGLIVKHPLQDQPTQGNDFPNGHRPAGGQ